MLETIMSPPVEGPTLFNFFTDCFGPTTNGGQGSVFGVGSGSGNSVLNSTASDSSHPGVLEHGTGTTANGKNGLASHLAAVVFGGGEWFYENLLQLPLLSGAAQEFFVQSGFGDSVNATPTVGAWFEYSHGLNGGNWQCNVSDGVTTTNVDSGVVVAINTWYKLTIKVNGAGSLVQFFINGVLVASVTVGIPNSGAPVTGFCYLIRKTVGIVARTMLVDYLHVQHFPSTVR